MKLKYLGALDGIRGIAALMVMVFHFFAWVSPDNSFLALLKKVAVFGQTGVSLFFVLSGFLITRILFNTKETPGYFLNFYVRRSLRIFPLYYLFLVLYYFVFPHIIGEKVHPFSLQVYHWTYLQNFAMTFNWASEGPEHFWSLAVEEHFYLFWPFLVFILNNKRMITMVAIILIGSSIVRFLLVSRGLEPFYFTFSRIDELAVGALLAVLERKQLLTPKNAPKFLYLFGLIMIPTLGIWVVFTGTGNNVMQVVKFILLSFCYFSVIGYVVSAKETNIFNRLLQKAPLLYTGKISYGLYVYHPVCFAILSHFLWTKNVAVNFVLCFASAYLVATVSYYLFEQKFLKFKKYFEYKAATPQMQEVNRA